MSSIKIPVGGGGGVGVCSGVGTASSDPDYNSITRAYQTKDRVEQELNTLLVQATFVTMNNFISPNEHREILKEVSTFEEQCGSFGNLNMFPL